jgi:hypothetical protein
MRAGSILRVEAMTKSKWFGALAVVLVLAGCGGGGGDAGTSPFGGGGGTTRDVADLNLLLSKTSLTDSGSDSLTVTVTAVDSSRVAVASAPVTVGADNGAVVVASSTTTDSSGKLTATVGTGSDKSNRTVTITATSGTITKTTTFDVTGAVLSATLTPSVVAPGAAGQIKYSLKDSSGAAISGASITVTAGGIPDVTSSTDSHGEYLYSYTAPATTGNLNFTAVSAGFTLVQTVQVQSGGTTTIPPATAGSVTSASISADPSVVSVNTSSSTSRAEIRALFLGAANAPIKNIRVRFDLAGDANSVGGTFTTGTDLVYSDVNGVVTSAYVPGSRSSPTDGVTIRACWDYTDFAVGTCPNSTTKTITVTSEALAVSIGFDATISDGSSGLTYVKKFVVTVADAAGQAKSDILITPSIDLVNYIKGFYITPGAWTLSAGSGQKCANEDINRNGVLEATEDFNTNGQLDPRKSDVLVSVVGSNKTNSSGIVVLQIEYPKSVATWIQYKLSVTAGGVSGTEGRASLTKILTADAASFTATTAPAFVVSPYGTGTGAPTTYTPPGGSPITVCTDPN